MNVLITGGYGFIGSFVAERFYKEGHKVFILDNLSSGSASNIYFKHKFFEMNVEDERCADIFKINTFDVVVHLAAKSSIPSSFENPHKDTNSNVIGLVNMLDFSNKYGVKRFIFLSSADVYGDTGNFSASESMEPHPGSPHAVNKLLGEEYCRIYNEIYGLSTVSLRVSNVYGPRQGIFGEGGVVSEFIKNAIDTGSIHVFGNGQQTRDFIYVQDVTDAVYRCIESDYSGILNLSTKTGNSINKLISILNKQVEIKHVVNGPARDFEAVNSILDNTQIKRELDWVPMYNLEEGITKTVEWFREEYLKLKKTREKPEIKRKAKGSVSKLIKKMLPIIENILIFGIVAMIEYRVPEVNSFFFIDLKLIYIILMAIMYGSKQAILAVALSTVLFVYSNLNEGRDLLSTLFIDTNSLMRVAYYIFIGFLVGHTIDMKNRSVKSIKNSLEVSKEKLEFLNIVYNETKTVKDELQKQIRMSEDSIAKVYSIIKDLDTLNPEMIYNSAIPVLEKIMRSKGIAIYVISKNGYYARIAASSVAISQKVQKSLRLEDGAALNSLMETRDIIVNKEFEAGMPKMMAPVESDGKVVALLALFDVDFESINLYYKNLLKIVANFISASLSKAIAYQEATRKDRYVIGTNILKREEFNEILKNRIQATELEVSYYSIIVIEAYNDLFETDYLVSQTVRETDYVGIGEEGRLYILLANTNETEARIVIKRLSDKGIAAYLKNGDELVA